MPASTGSLPRARFPDGPEEPGEEVATRPLAVLAAGDTPEPPEVCGPVCRYSTPPGWLLDV